MMKGPSTKDQMFAAQKPQKGARLSVRGLQMIITEHLKKAG
jgi:hypothetical protein